jgi:hypothetical protein
MRRSMIGDVQSIDIHSDLAESTAFVRGKHGEPDEPDPGALQDFDSSVTADANLVVRSRP